MCRCCCDVVVWGIDLDRSGKGEYEFFVRGCDFTYTRIKIHSFVIHQTRSTHRNTGFLLLGKLFPGRDNVTGCLFGLPGIEAEVLFELSTFWSAYSFPKKAASTKSSALLCGCFLSFVGRYVRCMVDCISPILSSYIAIPLFHF